MRIITASNLKTTSFSERCWKSQRDYAERIGAQWNHYRIPAMPYPNRYKLEIIVSNTQPGEKVLWLDWDVEMSSMSQDLSQWGGSFLAFDVSNSRINEPFNNGMMLSDHSCFAKIKPVFDSIFRTRVKLREELVTQLSLEQLGIAYTLVADHMLGIKHHVGSKKYEN